MFLYLVPAVGDIMWTDLPGVRLEDALQYSPGLAGLEWEKAGITRTWDDVRVALRHGEPVEAGIAVPGLMLTDLRREDEVRMHNTAARTYGEAVADQDDFMETLMPGWKEHGERLNRDIDRAVEDRAVEYRDRVAELLAADLKTHLVEHWRQLGGQVPDPL